MLMHKELNSAILVLCICYYLLIFKMGFYIIFNFNFSLVIVVICIVCVYISNCYQV